MLSQREQQMNKMAFLLKLLLRLPHAKNDLQKKMPHVSWLAVLSF